MDVEKIRAGAYRSGVEDAVILINRKADELAAFGNPTALTMSRIYRDLANEIGKLCR